MTLMTPMIYDLLVASLECEKKNLVKILDSGQKLVENGSDKGRKWAVIWVTQEDNWVGILPHLGLLKKIQRYENPVFESPSQKWMKMIK